MGPAIPASGVAPKNCQSRKAMGINVATIIAPTNLIGISRSVKAKLSPADRAAEAAIAPLRPCTIGPMILSKVHMAATPIVPAPMKRAFSRNTVPAISAAPAPATPWLK